VPVRVNYFSEYKLGKSLKSGLPWVFLFVISMITFDTYWWQVNSDMAHWYLTPAMNIFEGKGYTTLYGELITHRAPGFALMLATSYWLLGPSIWSAVWVVKIFCFLTPASIFLLGKRLVNPTVGFSAALLCLTSYGISVWAYESLNAVWPFFVFISVYCVLEGFSKDNSWFLLLGGMALGLGFLVKEIVIPFFFVPLLLLIAVRDFRSPSNFKRILYFYLSLIVCLLPWIVYVYGKTGGLSDLFGLAGLDVLNSLMPSSETSVKAVFYNESISLIDNFIRFYKGQDHSLSHWFSVAPLFIICWTFVGYRFFKRSKTSIVLSILFFLFLPVINYVGNLNWHPGEYLYVCYLSYLVVAYAVFLGSKRFFGSRHYLGFVIIVAAILGFQSVFSYKSDKGHLQFISERSYLFQTIKDWKFPERGIRRGFGSGFFDGASITGGRWLKENLPRGSNLLITSSSLDLNVEETVHPLYFYTEGRFNFSLLPPVFNAFPWLDFYNYLERNNEGDLGWLRRWGFHLQLFNTSGNVIAVFNDLLLAGDQRAYHYLFEEVLMDSMQLFNTSGNVIAVFNDLRLAGDQRAYHYLFEEVLMDSIRERKIDYIVVHPFHYYLSSYFDRHSGFVKMQESPTRFRTYDSHIEAYRGGTFVIYKVIDPHISENITSLLSPRVISHLKKLALNDQRRFEEEIAGLKRYLQIGDAEMLEVLELPSEGAKSRDEE